MTYNWFEPGHVPFEELFNQNRFQTRYGDQRGSGTKNDYFEAAGFPCFQPREEDRWKFSTAPHIISLAGSIFIAYSRVCITACQINPAGAHQVSLPEHTDAQEVVEIVLRFLDALAPRSKYTIEIYTPTDISNEMAYVTILISVWKNLSGFESQIVQEDGIAQVLFQFFDQNEIVVNCRETVLAATLEGSMEMIHFRPTSKSDGQISRVPSTPFLKDNVLMFIKTDQAPATPFPSHMVDDSTTETMLRDVEANAPKLVGELIANQHEALHNEERFCVNIDRAFTNFKNEPVFGELAHGYEVQREGAVVLFMKLFWGNVKAKMMFFSQIANTAVGDIRSITFEALIPSGGAIRDPDHAQKYKNTRKVCVELSRVIKVE